MKPLKLVITAIFIISAFFVGRYYDELFVAPIADGQIVISQELHDWSIDKDKGTKPVFITIFAKNESKSEINGPVKFQIDLDASGLEKSFIDSLIVIIGEEGLIKEKGISERFKAIAAYIKRGKKPPEGMDYEPIKNASNHNYSTVVTSDINLKAGESKKFELEVMIPPNVRGYVLTIKQI